MAGFPSAVDIWFAGHQGTADRGRLRRLALSDDQIDGLVGHGHLVRVHRGVYRSAQGPALGLAGSLVARVTDRDVHDRLDETVRHLVGLYDARAVALDPSILRAHRGGSTDRLAGPPAGSGRAPTVRGR